ARGGDARAGSVTAATAAWLGAPPAVGRIQRPSALAPLRQMRAFAWIQEISGSKGIRGGGCSLSRTSSLAKFPGYMEKNGEVRADWSYDRRLAAESAQSDRTLRPNSLGGLTEKLKEANRKLGRKIRDRVVLAHLGLIRGSTRRLLPAAADSGFYRFSSRHSRPVQPPRSRGSGRYRRVKSQGDRSSAVAPSAGRRSRFSAIAAPLPGQRQPTAPSATCETGSPRTRRGSPTCPTAAPAGRSAASANDDCAPPPSSALGSGQISEHRRQRVGSRARTVEWVRVL